MFEIATAALSRAILPLSEDGGGFHGPSLTDFFPPTIFGEGTFYEFNRIMMVRLIATAVLVTLFLLVSRNPRIVPGRGQSIAEIALQFVRVNIAEETLGKERAKPWVPVLTIIFFAVFAMNITGVIPGLNIAGSSVVGFPLVVAVIAWFAFMIAGLRARGLRFFKEQTFPPGVPWPLYIILAPIEVLSTFILRPITLTIRLLANMMSGHFILVLAFAATNALFLEASLALKPLGLITLGASFAFYGLELFIAALQAYIFALLTAVYISLSVESH